MQRFARRQTVELGGNGGGGVWFEEDVPAGAGGRLLKQRQELAGLDVRADTILVGLPVQGVSGPGRQSQAQRHCEPQGGQDASRAARSMEAAAAAPEALQNE